MMKRIVWAMNPFSDDSVYFRRALRNLGDFAAAEGAKVEPVYVLAPPSLMLPDGADFSSAGPPAPKLEEAWKKLTRGIPQAKYFMKPTLLTDSGITHGSLAKSLSSYAEEIGADCIAVATHGRKGMARFFLGSFAETLLHHTSLPTVVVNPGVEKKAKVRTLFFAVDLPFASEAAFGQVLAFAKERKAKLFLYHKLDYVNEFTYHPLFNVPMYQDYLVHDVDSRKKELQALAARAQAAGVEVSYRVDLSGKPVAAAIQGAAKRAEADLIAIVSRSGRVQSALMGSIARQVVRGAGCPVWIFHPAKTAARASANAPVRAVAAAKSQR